MDIRTIAPGTLDVYVMPDRDNDLELVWRHAVTGLGLVEVSLSISRESEKELAKMIQERSIYIGQDAHGTPVITLRLSDMQSECLLRALHRAQDRRRVYERQDH